MSRDAATTRTGLIFGAASLLLGTSVGTTGALGSHRDDDGDDHGEHEQAAQPEPVSQR